MQVTAGRAGPLGVTAQGHVAVHAAAPVSLCLFDDADTEVARLRLPGRTGSIFHAHVAGLAAGQRYALRVDGHDGLLIDPYATRLDRVPRLHGPVPRAIVEAPFPALPPLPRSDAARVIYELHVRGFTMTHPAIPADMRGTFAGIAHPAAIAHLVGLGVTHVELLPCAAWIEERHLPPLGLTNYWGYNPIAFLAPDPRLAPGGMADVRAAIAALHAAGIGVLLDVVFNHTGEGDALGPSLSLRGLDEAGYYRMAEGRLVDDAGCGNTLACDRPLVVRLVMDALRHWAAAGVDGFRFDLTVTLGRSAAGFSPDAPLLAAMAQDPVLRDRLLVMEPWDIGPGGYQLGAFRPGQPEWNDRFRDGVRRFWRGDHGHIGTLATRLAGSADIFAQRHRPATDSLNFITAHDGFSLADLVAFTVKRNQANGEDNRDGTDDNAAWNNGVEGPTEDAAILARRAADVRALLATLLVARGTPMLSMGDEAGRSQGGNNNAYAQDNPTSWFDWQGMDQALFAFTARLVAARRAHPALHGAGWLTGEGAEMPDVAWLRADGQAIDWHDPHGRTLLVALHDAAADDRVLIAIHGDEAAADATLPPPRPGRRWTLLADTADPRRLGPVPGQSLTLPPRSVLLLAEERRAQDTGLDPALLGRLAAAAGIAPDWWGFDGQRHAVPPDSQRAILHAMHLPAATSAEARDSLRHLAEDRDLRPLPFSAVLRPGGLLPLVVDDRRCTLTIARADGGTEDHVLAPWDLATGQRIAADGRRVALRLWPLPPLPVGRHVLGLDGVVCHLTVTPGQGFLPAALADGGRRFGVTAQLYTLRDGVDRGLGDLGTLGAMARATAAMGGAVLGVNPLHMLFPQDRSRASPYHPSDRRFIDPMLIAIGPARPGGALIDYPGVWAGKRAALEAAFVPDAPGLAAFRAAGGAALEDFATFQAIAETPRGADWRRWPAGLRAPGSEALAQFAAQNAPRVAFHAWLQFRAEADLAAAASSGLEIGLYRDLAVGCAPDGAEAWANQAGLLPGLSIGAPPDAFAEDGQVWGLPPPNPLAEARDGHATFAALLAANMRHAGALRIDHVLGLRRLFLVPDGARGAEGAYLERPLGDLLGHAALESQAARCLVVGEDLGTIPDGMAEALAGAGVLSTRVLLFERDGDRFRPPSALPANAAVHVMTHDLPTLVGWWQGADLTERAALGMSADTEGRAAEKDALLAMLAEAGLWDGSAEMTPALAAAIHAAIAASDASLAFVQADDLVPETVSVNMPGTDRERPNWRRRLSVPVSGLATTPYAAAILEALRKLRP